MILRGLGVHGCTQVRRPAAHRGLRSYHCLFNQYEEYYYYYYYYHDWYYCLSRGGCFETRVFTPEGKCRRLPKPQSPLPATWKHGWSKHDSSTMPSRHSIPQDLYSPCLNLTNSARSMFTPTMFLRRRALGYLAHASLALGATERRTLTTTRYTTVYRQR